MNNKKIYLAGDMFKKGDITERRLEAEQLRTIEGLDVFNPIDAPFNDKANVKPTAEDIYWGDTNEIMKSHYLSVELEPKMDEGVCFEMGVVSGINIVLDLLKKGCSKESILDVIPEKEILAQCSDIRRDSEGYSGVRTPFGLNQYMIGGVLENGKIFKDFDEILEYLKSKGE